MAVSTLEQTNFTELVRDESQSWVAASAIIVGSRARAEEITQEVLTKTFERWKKVSKMDRPGAWVRRAVINESISSLRRTTSEAKALRKLRAVPNHPTDVSDPAHEIWAKVRELPEVQCKAIALFYGADQSIEHVAEDLDLSVSAAKTALYRARTTLRNTLSDQEVG